MARIVCTALGVIRLGVREVTMPRTHRFIRATAERAVELRRLSKSPSKIAASHERDPILPGVLDLDLNRPLRELAVGVLHPLVFDHGEGAERVGLAVGA